jgi:hypothetical protein
MTPFIGLFIIFLAAAPVLLPNFVWHVLMVVDYLHPTWKMFNDPYVMKYHDFLMSRLPDVPEREARIIPLEGCTREKIREASNGYTVPVIIRGAVADAKALHQWTNTTWWLENYGDEEVLCKYVEGIKDGDAPSCTVKDAFAPKGKRSDRLYISGESKLFQRRPELQEMVDTPFIESVAPGKRVFTQIFMGFPGMGSDVHAAIGCNLFRMIAGRKKWWLIPQTQTAYVYASINPNGFSAHTKTRIGKGKEQASPWFKKLERYSVTLEPGDLLLNTAWYWHGIMNLGEDPDQLVIGVPTRYAIEYSIPAFRSNWLLSTIALAAIQKQFGGKTKFTSNAGNLQDGIERARKARANQIDGKDAAVPVAEDGTVLSGTAALDAIESD